MSVLRQLPRKSRIMSAVRPAAIAASLTTPSTAARTKIDWSKSSVTLSSFGQRRRASPAAIVADALDDVERARAPVLQDRHEHATACRSTCTMFVCGA